MHRFTWLLLVIVSVIFCAHLAESSEDPLVKMWNLPVAPSRLIGNIYYVGASEVSSFLIVTPAGDFILDAGFEQTAPLIEANIKKLGFKLQDVKYLLVSHTHYDHAGGLLRLKKDTGAKMVALDAQSNSLKTGTPDDFAASGRVHFPAIAPDKVLHDSDSITLGGTVLKAHLTPGHTRGCTTWTTTVSEKGKTYKVVFAGSTSILPKYNFTDHPTYPGIATDFQKTFKTLRSLDCDVFLAAHPSMFNLADKRKALEKGSSQNPFVDPEGYQHYIDTGEAAFKTKVGLEKLQSAASK